MSEKRIFVIRLSTGAALGVAVAAAVATPLSAASAAPQSAPSQATTSVASAQADADQDHAALGLSKDEKLVVRNVITDADGTQHVRYDRTFKGLRVVGGDLIVEKSEGGSDKDVRYNASGKVAVTSTTPTGDEEPGRCPRAKSRRQADASPRPASWSSGPVARSPSWPTTCW